MSFVTVLFNKLTGKKEQKKRGRPFGSKNKVKSTRKSRKCTCK